MKRCLFGARRTSSLDLRTLLSVRAAVTLPARGAVIVRSLTRLAVLAIIVAAAAPASITRAGEEDGTGRVLSTGLSLIDRYYLFYDQLEPERLLGEALEYVEDRIPEFRSEPLDDRAFAITAPGCRLRVELEPNAGLTDIRRPLEEVAEVVDRCVTELPEGSPPVGSLLLKGVLSGLDPYSTVLDARRRTEHTIQFRGKLAGIGARIGIRDNRLTLITVYPGSPADKAGLQDDDAVLRIDDLSAANILVGDAVERIRGKEGTKVALTVEREGEPEPLVITVTRGVVVIPSVTAKLLDNGVLQAEISHFSQTTPEDFRARVGEVVDAHDVRGIVIDLRANSGGSMLGSSSIADMFLSSGVLITTAGRDGNNARGLASEVLAESDTPFHNYPVAFLTSPRTASGSELLAASMRNHDRAIIVGERTYGKGTVQKTNALSETSTLKMTVGHFLPNGRPIPGGGLIPDVEIVAYRFGEDSVSVPFTKDTSDLPFWLRLPSWAEPSSPVAAFALAVAEEDATDPEDPHESSAKPEPKNEEDETEDRDQALEIASSLLAEYGSTAASVMLRSARGFMTSRIEQADTDLVAFMKDKGVDWSPGQRPSPLPTLELSVSTDKDLVAGDSSKLTVSITNKGREPLFRIRGHLDATAALLNRRSLLFGQIAPGATRSWELTVEPSKGSRNGRIEITAELTDDEGPLAKPGPVFIAVAGGAQPHLAYRTSVTAREDDDSTLDIAVEIDNRGDGPTKDLAVRIQNPLNGAFEIVEGSSDVEPLQPGKQARVELAVRLLESSVEAPVAELTVSDFAFGLFLKPELALVPSQTAGDWHTPPSITVGAFVETGEEGTYELIVRASDDRGLATVRTRVDGDTVDYVARAEPGPRELTLEVPWTPAGGVKSFTVVATDTDGLESRYFAGL